MSNQAFKDFMKLKDAYPKLRFETGQIKELIFVTSSVTSKIDPAGKEKAAVKIVVRDRTDGEIKQWITESITVADSLRNIEPKMIFTAQPTKQGAKKGWQIEIKGYPEGDDNEKN